MAWLKLDDGFLDHPKVVWVGRDARDLHLQALSWCMKWLATGGVFPRSRVPIFAAAEGLGGQEEALTARLLSCPPGWPSGIGLWEHGPTPDTLRIHNFDAHLPPKTSADRTQKYRERKRGDVTCDGGSTSQQASLLTSPPGSGSGEGAGRERDQEGSVRGEEERGKPGGTKINLPDWLPAALWGAWQEHRRHIRAPMTAHAARLTLRKLAAIRGQHGEGAAIQALETAIERGWRGVFPPGGDRTDEDDGPEKEIIRR